MLNDVITLVKVTKGKSATGAPNTKGTETQRTVFGQVSSVGYREYFAAKDIGITLSLIVTLYRADYDGENELEFDDRRYRVERTYLKDGDRNMMELHCVTKEAM